MDLFNCFNPDETIQLYPAHNCIIPALHSCHKLMAQTYIMLHIILHSEERYSLWSTAELYRYFSCYMPPVMHTVNAYSKCVLVVYTWSRAVINKSKQHPGVTNVEEICIILSPWTGDIELGYQLW